MTDKLKVFLCHASEDKSVVQGLYDELTDAGFDPWLDEKVLLLGADWDREIKIALRKTDTVIVCLSSKMVGKEGYVQKELRYAQDVQSEKPSGTIFLIPLRLDNCEVPFELREINWGDYTSSGGFEKIVRSLNARAKQLGKKRGQG